MSFLYPFFRGINFLSKVSFDEKGTKKKGKGISFPFPLLEWVSKLGNSSFLRIILEIPKFPKFPKYLQLNGKLTELSCVYCWDEFDWPFEDQIFSNDHAGPQRSFSAFPHPKETETEGYKRKTKNQRQVSFFLTRKSKRIKKQVNFPSR